MICPMCASQGLKSKVRLFGTSTTCMAFNTWYDEEGKYHSHDPNWNSTGFECTNKHGGVIKKKNKCPSCSYGSKSEEIKVFDVE